MGYNFDSTKLWWKANKHSVQDQLMHIYDQLKGKDEGRLEQNRRWLSHYLNRFDENDRTSYNNQLSPTDTYRTDFKRKTVNLSRLVVDTARSRLAIVRPKPTLLVSGGDHSLRKQANLYEKALDGLIWNTGAYKELPSLLTSAEIYGMGIWHIYLRGNQFVREEVHPNEILVDHDEAQHQTPRSLFRHKLVSREVLLEHFPDKKELIKRADAVHNDTSENLDLGPYVNVQSDDILISDMILCIEAWHLPSGGGAGDGRHVLCLENGVIFDEEYTLDRFPFVFLPWEPSKDGFWPTGLVENVVPYDVEANLLLRRISVAAQRGTMPMVFMDEGSMNADQINSDIANIYEIRNGSRDPRFVVPNAVSSDLYNHVNWLIEKAYETSGVNQMSAAGMKPAGVQAAVAMRELNDLQTQRFLTQSMAIEQAFIDFAEIVLDLLETFDEGEDEFPLIHTVDGHEMLELDLKEIKLQRDSFVIRMFPTNLLPETPAAKKAEIEEMIQVGLLSPEEALEMKIHPDTEKLVRRRTASTRAMERIIEKILEDGKYIAPEPFMDDLPGKINMARDAYFEAVINDVAESKLAGLRRWIQEATDLIQPPEPPAPIQPPDLAAPEAVAGGAPDLAGSAQGIEGVAGGLEGVALPPGVM